MGILNRTSDGLLSVLLVLRRALIATGPLSREDLLALCAPEALTTFDGRSLSEVRKQASQTLSKWTKIGMFVEDEAKISLAPEFKSKNIEADSLRALRTKIRKLVLEPGLNLDLNAEPDSDSAGVCADLTRALCWTMAQDVYTLPGGGHEPIQALELSQIEQKPYIFQNNTRWPGLKEWAVFLGFGWTWSSPAQFVVDPTEALLDALPDVFAEQSELPQSSFLSRLAKEQPVFDGGSYRTLVEERIAKNWRQPEPHQLSTSLSRALLRAESLDIVRLEERADAPKRMLLGRKGKSLRSFSHIVKGQKS